MAKAKTVQVKNGRHGIKYLYLGGIQIGEAEYRGFLMLNLPGVDSSPINEGDDIQKIVQSRVQQFIDTICEPDNQETL